jgi:hypothetical protein
MPTAVVCVSPATDISPSACFRAESGAPHFDYLPRHLEAKAMGSYAEHHEALCGQYASRVHLGSLAGAWHGSVASAVWRGNQRANTQHTGMYMLHISR